MVRAYIAMVPRCRVTRYWKMNRMKRAMRNVCAAWAASVTRNLPSRYRYTPARLAVILKVPSSTTGSPTWRKGKERVRIPSPWGGVPAV
jgi:hypothetical protein